MSKEKNVLGGAKLVNWAMESGIGILCLAGVLSLAAVAQHRPGTAFHPQAQANSQKPPKNSNNNPKPPHKMGDWLNEHKNLPPDQQEKLLENDPSFKKLPPDRQAALKERLRKFNNLPPEQQERVRQRMQFMASLSPEQRQQIREANQTLQGLPQHRQVMVHKALRHLRQMDPHERAQVMNSDRFKSTFSEQERGVLTKLSAINPPERGAPSPQSPPNEVPKRQTRRCKEASICSDSY